MMWQTVRQNYKLPLFLGIGISVVAVLFSALFNKFSDQLSPFVSMMPAGMKAVVGDLAIGTTPEGWLSIELFPLAAGCAGSDCGIDAVCEQVPLGAGGVGGNSVSNERGGGCDGGGFRGAAYPVEG